ncbi:Pimeloyl-ACP methyl ester carboxylesterase [Variovorax sp. OV329]|nr:Pimeloyl-ACP methyl ester carboxylesterase [Variovorax sp. OV329]
MERVERVDFGGGRVCWRRFGDAGPPLVLVHGGHGSWLHWARNVEDLATRYTVWAPDLPGYGHSDEPPGSSVDALVDATLRSLDTLVPKEQPLRLVGFSFGGLVAAHVAARRDGVSHLGLLGPAGHGGPRRPRGELHAWRGLEPHSSEWNEVMRHNLLMHMLHDPAQVDALALHIHGNACLRTRFHSKTVSRKGGLSTLLERHRGKLLAAWGAHDVTLDPGFVMSSMSGRFNQPQLKEIAGAGHWVQFEAAKAVNELLLCWLEGGAVEGEFSAAVRTACAEQQAALIHPPGVDP